jgi:predicted nucleic acid-binding protein
MTTVFADTAFYVAVLNPRDDLAEAAEAYTRTAAVKVVTTEFVLIEVANFFSRPASRAAYVRLVSGLRADPDTTIRPASPDLFERALQLFAARPDKDWSLTDRASFVVMTDLNLTDALTADRHFEQAGFRALLA